MPLSGVIIIDKPAGKTSHDVVQDVKRALRVKKAGHAGTLDPLATGVLPVCVNEGTKLAGFLAGGRKEYRVTMLLGVKTDTLDIEGAVVEHREPRVGQGDIERALAAFSGKIVQQPPRYSAIKHKGRALHQWARKGTPVDAPPRDVEIYEIRLESVRLPHVTFHVSCSKGTYMRSLCDDIGERLGCGACLSALRRTRSGPFQEGSAVPLEHTGDRLRSELEMRVMPLSEMLPELASVTVDAGMAERIRRGFQPTAESLEGKVIPSIAAGDVIKFITPERELVALARWLRPAGDRTATDPKERAVEILRVFQA